MGFFNTDVSWMKTHDVFLRKGSLIVNYMIDRIENDEEYSQMIRRLCRYMTIDPLAFKSTYINAKGEEVEQKQLDLKDSLCVSSFEGTRLEIVDGEKTTTIKPKPVLYNGGFNQEMKTIDQCYVFVHNYRNNPVGKDTGLIYVRIDIIIPDKYDKILDFDSGLTIKRGDALCFLIDDLFNKRVIKDEKFSKYLGNLKFNLYDNYNARLTKTSDGAIYTLIYTLATPTMEILNGNL